MSPSSGLRPLLSDRWRPPCPADRQGRHADLSRRAQAGRQRTAQVPLCGGRDQAVHGRRADDLLSRCAPGKATPWCSITAASSASSPQPGIEYRIRIIEEKIDNPPAEKRVFDPLDARPGDRAARGQAPMSRHGRAPLPRRRGCGHRGSGTPGSSMPAAADRLDQRDGGDLPVDHGQDIRVARRQRSVLRDDHARIGDRSRAILVARDPLAALAAVAAAARSVATVSSTRTAAS